MATAESPTPSAPDPGPPAPARTVRGGARKMEDLPKEVGVMLMSVGALGFVLPALAGAPAIVAGGLVLWPRTFGKVDRWVQRRYPWLHEQGMQQIGRYLDDLEQRFPDSTRR
ncbi:hypothetical protein [Paludisphaera mucosa]|uniref:Uncharacterized protein n=1 Tax=Paludisphaera mucosa TaxID=3030827 RepID=A0ABT6FHQ8_9BACT|nr:hypothetical protein [Paludisphaera mucosa]MDG3007101.1 hypothetical protein [Paludisphaera mucosa]